MWLFIIRFNIVEKREIFFIIANSPYLTDNLENSSVFSSSKFELLNTFLETISKMINRYLLTKCFINFVIKFLSFINPN